MTVTLVTIAARQAEASIEALAGEYLRRFGFNVTALSERFRSEADFLEALRRDPRRWGGVLVLLDGAGRQLSSEQLASWIQEQREAGRQHLVFAVGPADGWSGAARAAAGLLLSLGPMTLPHELARVVIAEQVYRAFTILAGHPYHSGH